jgi:rubrerythrin
MKNTEVNLLEQLKELLSVQSSLKQKYLTLAKDDKERGLSDLSTIFNILIALLDSMIRVTVNLTIDEEEAKTEFNGILDEKLAHNNRYLKAIEDAKEAQDLPAISFAHMANESKKILYDILGSFRTEPFNKVPKIYPCPVCGNLLKSRKAPQFCDRCGFRQSVFTPIGN